MMETKQALVQSGDAETAMQSCCGKRSNAKRPTLKEDDTKRKRNDGNDSHFDGLGCHKNEEMKLIVDDLPNEILEVILRNLATSDLINCRKMNRKWHEISSHIMRKRADIKIAFSYQGGQLSQSIQHYPRQTLLKDFWPMVNELSFLSFKDLVVCLKQSRYFPFTNFYFKDVIKSDDGDDIEQLLSIWGKNIYALGVKINEVDDVEMLRVLMEKTPNLKKLHVYFGGNDYYEPRMKPDVYLFADSNEFQLPSLNVLCVTGNRDCFAGVVADILKVAPNLNCFEKHSRGEHGSTSDIIEAKDLAMLQSLNKLHCLKNIKFLFKEELITLLESSPQIMDLQLKSFELSNAWIWNVQQLSSRATKIINKIFDSSKNSLQELKIPAIGLLPGLVIPRFENLEKMCLSHDESYEDDTPSMFPPLFEMADHFPNLRELTAAFFTEDNYFSTYQPLNVMPKVELLRIVFDTEYDETLMKLTPNVKTLLVSGTDDKRPSLNFKAIATHLKTLENLGWQIYAESQQDLLSSCVLDSIITGFSTTFCKKKSAQFRGMDHLPAKTVASYERYRKNLSILDLKELKRFDMSFTISHNSYGSFDFDAVCSCEESDCECGTDNDESCDMAGFYSDSNLHQTCLTKVSQFLAFDLVPDLDLNVISRYLR